jgi:hypothetical protein
MLLIRSIIFLCLFCSALSAHAIYRFEEAPIDVVIPCAKKDLETLQLCVQGIKKYGDGINRIIVISDERFAPFAEWFDEKQFPFTKQEIAINIFKDSAKGMQFLTATDSRIGWIYQQFLKLYAPLVIPGISSNVLILDADTIFLRPVNFLHKRRFGTFTPGTEYHKPYFDHMQRAIPWLRKIYPQHSGIAHHMLFQKEIIQDLLRTIESHHHEVAWKALCHAIDLQEVTKSCMSEYELYFNFALMRTGEVKIRPLKWKNVATLGEIEKAKKEGYDYVSCHSYLRK